MKLNKGDIVFVKGKSIISKTIMAFDKGKFSHCGIAISDTTMIEAEYSHRTGAVIFDPSNYSDYEVIDLGLDATQRESVKREALALIGKRYDFGQILWYVIGDLFNIKGKNRFNNPNNLICSELVYIVLHNSKVLDDLGIKESFDKGVDLTPNQLYDLLKFASKKVAQKNTRRDEIISG